MSLRETTRVLIRDNHTNKRYSDGDLDLLIDNSIVTNNGWFETNLDVNDYDATGSSVPARQRSLLYLQIKIDATAADLQDVDRYVKLVTQDVQRDPESAMRYLERLLLRLEKDMKLKLEKWVGLDYSKYMGHPGTMDKIVAGED